MKKILIPAMAVVAVVFTTLMLVLAYPHEKNPQTFNEAKNGVVYIETEYGSGSGFCVGNPGEPVQYVVTNHHVVFDTDTGEKADNVVVFFSEKANKFMVAHIVAYDARTDYAVLKLPEPTTERQALTLIRTRDADLTRAFYALGYPARSSEGVDFMKYDKSDITTTSGIISKTSIINETDVLMLDIEITSGNSGGPLVNEYGQVIGINTFAIIDNEDRANYAVSIDEVLNALNYEEISYTLSTDINVRAVVVIVIVAVIDIILIAGIILFALDIIGKAAPKTAKVKQNKVQHDNSYNSTVAVSNDLFKTVAVGGPDITISGIAGKYSGKDLILRDSLVFGRDSKKCDIVFEVDTEGVSGGHCKLYRKGSNVMLQDIGSTYGTFVNGGLKIEKHTEVRLSDGDTFYLGSEKQKFVINIK